MLTAIIFYRLIFHGSLPERFMPTLFIFIAPPAVGFLSYLNLAGGLDAFARVLYGTALFFTALMLAQVPQLVRLRFFLSWWAYSFPLAAVTIATLVMAHETGARGYLWLGGALLGLLTPGRGHAARADGPGGGAARDLRRGALVRHRKPA